MSGDDRKATLHSKADQAEEASECGLKATVDQIKLEKPEPLEVGSANKSDQVESRDEPPAEDVKQSNGQTQEQQDDDLEEGELKDDDDDDDDDDDEAVANEPKVSGAPKKESKYDSDSSSKRSSRKRTRSGSCSSDSSRKSSKIQSRSSSKNSKSRSRSISSSSSSAGQSASNKTNNTGANKVTSNKGFSDNETNKKPATLTLLTKAPSVKSPLSPIADSRHDSYQHSYSSRHGSSGRQSPHSSRISHQSRRRHSPPGKDQAKLVSMRAKLLEARSREIEMKFQKTKMLSSTSPIPTLVSGPARNLKTTVTKPHITYCENPNPVLLVGPPSSVVILEDKKTKKHKKHEKRHSSKKAKKRKKKSSSSSSKKRKKRKTSETPTKKLDAEAKTSSSHDQKPIEESSLDHQGPRTPPDNRVLSLENEQIEWPSYLIKMTTTRPSISYSVNPASVVESAHKRTRSDKADLNADLSWYCNYFVNTVGMDKAQAQQQAYTAMISSGNYDEGPLNKWLEQRGILKQSTETKERDIYHPLMVNNHDSDGKLSSSATHHQDKLAIIPLRFGKPAITTMKLQKEVVLPNGKVLPVGTTQKIVHPYPSSDRVVPEVPNAYYDMY